MNVSPELQNQIAQFQQLQQQLQSVSTQKFQIEAQLNEVERTLEEMEKVDSGTPVYRNVGALMIKTNDTDKLKNELEEQKETLSIRVRTLERQEKTLRERYQEKQKALSEAISGRTGGAG